MLHTHTHTHTCKKSHLHVFKTIFLSLFRLKSSIFQVHYYEEILELYGVTATLLSVSHSLKTELGKGCTYHSTIMYGEHFPLSCFS
jgi:hypothetical protein